MDFGKGSPIVFLHGWGQNLNMMMPIAKSLSISYRCFVPDLFGFGGSDEFVHYEEFADYVEKVHDFVKSRGIENPILIAHSFGARIAICYAYRYGCKALILTGAAGIKAPLSFDRRVKIFLHRHHIKKSQGSLDYQLASPFLKRVLVDAVNLDCSEMCTRVDVPVLLVWGEKDQETPIWMARKMQGLFPSATLIEFQNQGHFAYFYEHERFAYVCMKFLEGVV